MGIVYEHGINDMPRGWASKNKWNRKVYKKWCHMLERCYDEKYHNKQPTYINCTICLEWHWLSKFANDVVKIDGYDKEKFINNNLELDKDIKSNGINKEYSLENCMLVCKKENSIQSTKTRDYSDIKGKNNPNYGGLSKEHIEKISGVNHYNAKQVAQYDLDGNLIKIWDYVKQISEELNISYSALKYRLQNKTKTNELNGYIWKYYND